MADLIITAQWHENNGTVIPSFAEVARVDVTVTRDSEAPTTETLTATTWTHTTTDAAAGVYTIEGAAVTGFTVAQPAAVTIEADGEAQTATINYTREGATMPFDSNVYCDFDSTIAQVTSGKNIILCLFNADGTDLLALAGQQSFELSIDTDSQDASTKDTKGGWGGEIAGNKTWTMSVDGLHAKGDETQAQLLRALANSTLLCAKVVEEITEEDGTVTYEPVYGGLVNATSYSDTANQDEMRSYSAELSGVGRLWVAAIATPEELAEVTAVPSNR